MPMQKRLTTHRLEKSIEFMEIIIDDIVKNRLTRPYATEQELVALIFLNDIKELSKALFSLFDMEIKIGKDSLTRIAIEKYFYLVHSLKKNDYAKAFILSVFINQRNKVIRLSKDNDFAKSFGLVTGQSEDQVMREFSSSKFSSFIDNYDDKQNELIDEYRTCFDYIIKDDQILKHKWYNYNGQTPNFRELLKSLGQEELYLHVYKNLSEEVHSNSFFQRYEAISIGSKSYFGIIEENPLDNDGKSLFIINKIIYDTLQLVFKKYDIPKKHQERYKLMLQETIDPFFYWENKY